MDWERRQSEASLSDRYGLGSFLRGLHQEFRTDSEHALSGFTFLHDAREMLAFSRQIERALLESQEPAALYVGFQNDQKLAVESRRYQHLREANVTVHAFGEGTPSVRDAEGLAGWYRLEPNHTLIDNQWFLVADGPEPIAFVGWEVSDDQIWGLHGITHPGKEFAGFVSDDRRVVDALIRHFEAVRASRVPETPSMNGDLRSAVNDLAPRRTMLLVDDGKRAYLRRAVESIVGAAPIQGCEYYLYDLSAASYLLDAYPAEENEDGRTFDAEFVRNALKRGYLADRMEQLAATGSAVRAVLPTGVGFSDLAEWCTRLEIDVVVVPWEHEQPSLFDRLRGYSLGALRSRVDCSIVVDDPGSGARTTHRASTGARGGPMPATS